MSEAVLGRYAMPASLDELRLLWNLTQSATQVLTAGVWPIHSSRMSKRHSPIAIAAAAV